jgi:hypothetical protein
MCSMFIFTTYLQTGETAPNTVIKQWTSLSRSLHSRISGFTMAFSFHCPSAPRATLLPYVERFTPSTFLSFM